MKIVVKIVVKMMRACMLFWVAGTVVAGEPQTVDALAEIRDFEVAALDATSILRRDEGTRFDVRVQWRDPSQRPPQAPASRIIRYLARCPEKALGVVAVATVDPSGKMLRSLVVPPGGTDFLPAGEGSREAQWLGQVCG